MVEGGSTRSERRTPAVPGAFTIHRTANDAGLGGRNAEFIRIALAIGGLQRREPVYVVE
jgi:hypothetical protein